VSFYPVAVNQVLAKIQQSTPVEVEETTPGFVPRRDGDAEWFLLESNTQEDYQLYEWLRANYEWIVGPNAADFAIIHVRHDPYKGVWLHYLPTDEYAPGCHQLTAW
jgi:hypothetical protein